jgi:hypothetical protein
VIAALFKGIFGAVTGFFSGGLWAYAAVAAITAATVGFGAYKVADWRIGSHKLEFERVMAKRDAQDAADKLENARSVARATDKAMTKTIELQRKTDEALAKANKQTIAATLDAAASRANTDGLRSTIAGRSATDVPNASLASLADYTHTLGELLGTCSREREEFARQADGHAIDALKLWEAWPVFDK